MVKHDFLCNLLSQFSILKVFTHQSNSVITNSLGPSIFVRYKLEGFFNNVTIWGQCDSTYCVHYTDEFVLIVFVLTEFDCICITLT